VSALVALREQLQRFDDEAFVALANRGLLRRATKDLEAQSPEIREASVERVIVATGDHEVCFDARGPAQARCSCPSTGVCQHILTASLWIQRSTEAPPSAPSGGTAGSGQSDSALSASDPAESLRAALLAFTPAELAAHASLPGYRWARELVLDLELPEGIWIESAQHVVINFARPRMSFRYLGGPVENLLCDTRVSKIEKYRVAAILAFQRVHGVEPALIEPRSRSRSERLDLGRDHALPEGNETSQTDSRSRLRASVVQLSGECIELGLSHLSRNIEERFSTLAVWAQGAEYYRLGLLLRRIADHVELLLERAGAADERRLFDELSLALGLVSALEAAEARGDKPMHLLGRARSRYEPVAALDLLGLGALPWRSASGFVGLTMLFWSPAERAFLACTDARPELQRGFNPMTRYASAGPWSGLASPSQATGQRLRLSNAQLSASGRISGAEQTQAQVTPIDGGELLAVVPACSRWEELLSGADQGRLSLLSEPQPLRDWTILAPSKLGAARFDPARQTTVWPLTDADGALLHAEIPYSEYSRAAIERLEALDPDRLGPGTRVVARLRRTDGALIAEPLSLIRSTRTGQGNPVDSLYFDPAPEDSITRKAISLLNRRIAPSVAASSIDASRSAVPADLLDLGDWLARTAERGISKASEGLILQEMATRLDRLRESGFKASPATVPEEPLAKVLLRTNYCRMQCLRLLGADEER